MTTTAMGLALSQMPRTWHDGGMLMGLHWVWWLVWILTVVVLLWGFRTLSKDRSGTRRRLQSEELAESDLRARYARGEIDEDEFERRLRVLHETRGSV